MTKFNLPRYKLNTSCRWSSTTRLNCDAYFAPISYLNGVPFFPLFSQFVTALHFVNMHQEFITLIDYNRYLQLISERHIIPSCTATFTGQLEVKIKEMCHTCHWIEFVKHCKLIVSGMNTEINKCLFSIGGALFHNGSPFFFIRLKNAKNSCPYYIVDHFTY